MSTLAPRYTGEVLLTLLLGLAVAGPWPDLVPLEAREPHPADTAVLVAVEDYAFVADVPGARQNAMDWHDWLTKTRGVPAERVDLLLDTRATSDAIVAAVRERAEEVGEGGRLWVLFVGHGAPDPSGHDGVLVGVDAQQTADGLYARSLKRSELLRAAGDASDVVVVLDACFSGRTGDGVVAPGLQPMIPAQLASSRGVTVLSAGTSDQFAGPLPGLDRPAFSYLTLGALRGWADLDNDGLVRASEAVRFGADTLMLLEEQTGRAQTPTLSGPDTTLAGGAEAAPNVVAIAAGRSDELVLDVDQAAYLDELKARHEALLARREAELRRVADTRARLVAESDAAWQPLESGSSLDQVQAFLDTWRGRRVSLDGVQHSFDLPAVAKAEARLLGLYEREREAREQRMARREAALAGQQSVLAEGAAKAWSDLQPTLKGGPGDAAALVGFVAHFSQVAEVGDERVRLDLPAVLEARQRLDTLLAAERPPEALAREGLYRIRYEEAAHEARRVSLNGTVQLGVGAAMTTVGVLGLTRFVSDLQAGEDDDGRILGTVAMTLPLLPGVMTLGVTPFRRWGDAIGEARQKRQAWKAARVEPAP